MNNAENARFINNELHKIEDQGVMGLTYNQLRSIVAIERLIARLEANPTLAEHLVFKGGFALIKLIDSPRFTHDLDASFYDISIDHLDPLIIDAAYQDLGDGVFFYDVHSEQIRINDQYPGIRYKMAFQIIESRNAVKNTAKLSRIHFDIALGDFVPDSIMQNKMTSILKHVEPFVWRVYSPQQIFSEKLQTAVARGITNSRSKDIYDIVKLFDCIENNAVLSATIKKIFQLRKTNLPSSFYTFFNEFNVFVLENSWRSVMVINKPDFSIVWEDFLKIVQKLDDVINSPIA